MDAAQIAAMIADREAGTPGPWRVKVNSRDDQVTCDLTICGDIFQMADLNGPQYAHQHPNARRMARVPDMEAAIIAQATELERLRAERDALRKVITEGRRAIGDHFAPHDCYATGPMTGDPIRDLVQCPACSFIAMHDTALKGGTQ